MKKYYMSEKTGIRTPATPSGSAYGDPHNYITVTSSERRFAYVIRCQILTNFKNHFTAGKRMIFLTKVI